MARKARPQQAWSPQGYSPQGGFRSPEERRLQAHASRRLLARRALAFAAAGGLLAYMAFEGAAYDAVPRRQIALVVWIVVAFGFAFGVLPRGRVSRLGLIPLAAAAGLLAWMALSLTWTGSDERTMEEIARTAGYLGLITLALSALNRHTFRAAAAGMSAAAAAVVAVSVASRLEPSLFPDALAVAELFSRSNRLDFPLDYWNAVGTWGAMTAAIGLSWSAHGRSVPLRALALALVPLAGLAVYLSYSRGGVVAIAVALVAVLALSRNRVTALAHALAAGAGTTVAILAVREQPQIANATGGAGGDAVAVALLAAMGGCVAAVVLTRLLRLDSLRLPPSVPRWVPAAAVAAVTIVTLALAQGAISTAWTEFRSEDSPVSAADPAARLTSAGGNRDDIWSSAVDAFEAEPLAGVGPGTFEFWWLANGNDEEYVRDAHSLYLEVLAELGIVGLLLLVGLLVGLLALALDARGRLLRRSDFGAHTAMVSVFAVFCVSAGVDWMWEETAVGALGLGGVAIAAAGGSQRLRGERRRGAVWRPGVRAVLVAVALLAAAVQVPGLAAVDRVRDSDRALAAGDPAGARQLALDATEAEPWSASAYAQLAQAERTDGNLAAAARAARKAIEREPGNWRWPLVLARIQLEAGERAAAIRTFNAGRRLAPHLPFYAPDSAYGLAIYGAG